MDNNVIRNRFDSLVSLRKTIDQTFQFIEKYIVPYRGEFFKPELSELEVQWRRRQIYDSTAVNAANLLASTMHAGLTSPSIKWFDLTFRDPKLRENKPAMEWLEECGDLMYQALNDSDFNVEAAEIYLDLTSFGTAVITEEAESDAEWQGLDFTALPVRECYFEPDSKGGILRLFRLLRYTKLQIEDKFDVLPPSLDLDPSDGDVDTKYDIVFCIYQRKEKKNADITRMLAPKERPWGYKYVLHNSGESLGEEGGYYEMPGFIVRWQKVSGARWGFSPAFVALSDILQLNEVVKQTSESRAKVIDPATITTERGLLGDLDLSAGGLTMVQSMDELRAFESGARFDQADAEIERLQQSIRRTFYLDKLELKDSPAMTATEVRERIQRMQRFLGPVLGRLQTDFLDPLIKRTFMIMLRAGQLPEQPESVAGMEMDIEYTGPLPRSQKAETADSIEQWLLSMVGVAEFYPDMLDVADTDVIPRKLAELRGVPASALKSEEEVEALREARAQAQQAAADIEQTRALGEATEAMGAGVAAHPEEQATGPVAVPGGQ